MLDGLDARGAWTTVLLVGDGGYQALCVSDSSARLFDAMFGSTGVPDVDAPGPLEAVATDLGVGAVDDAQLSLAAGRVGSQVTSVSYDSATRGRVVATVSAGTTRSGSPATSSPGRSRTASGCS